MIVSDVELPARERFRDTCLIALPDSTSVMFTLPSMGARSPWCVVDVSTGEIRRGRGMPGDLTALLHGTDDPHWGLAAYGLVRLRLDGRLEVTDVFRKGIGKYLRTLVDFDHDLLAVANRSLSSVLLVSKVDGSAVKRIKMAGPDLAYPLSDRRLRFLSFHHAEATDVDVARRKVITRHPLPYGQGARHVGDEVIVLSGERHDFRIVDVAADAEPGTTVILGVGDVQAPAGWDVVPSGIAVLDACTLEVRRRAPLAHDCVEVLGTDTTGRIVVSTRNGFLLLDPRTLAVTATHEQEQINGAVHLPGQDTACLLGDTSLRVVRW